MSKKRGLDIINVNNGSNTVGRVELISHAEYMHRLTGIDPYDDLPACEAQMHRCLDQDIILGLNFQTPDRMFKNNAQFSKKDEEGRTITHFGVDGTTYDTAIPMNSPGELLNFKPLEQEDWKDKLATSYLTAWRDSTEIMGDSCLVTLNLWTTLLHWGTNFPWEYFMIAAYEDPLKFNRLLDDFAAVSERLISRFADTDAAVIMCHDDLAMGDRTLFSPPWTRANIISRYERIFAPAKKKGKKILFISDGQITELVDDLVQVGVDGIIFEPLVDLKWMAEDYGRKIALIGNADVKILTNGTTTDAVAEVERCVEQANGCPGYAFCASGTIAYNVPTANVEAYIARQDKYRR